MKRRKVGLKVRLYKHCIEVEETLKLPITSEIYAFIYGAWIYISEKQPTEIRYRMHKEMSFSGWERLFKTKLWSLLGDKEVCEGCISITNLTPKFIEYINYYNRLAKDFSFKEDNEYKYLYN